LIDFTVLPPEVQVKVFARTAVAAERLRGACELVTHGENAVMEASMAVAIFDNAKLANECEAASYEREWDEKIAPLAGELEQ
jgi:hypothetical protein